MNLPYKIKILRFRTCHCIGTSHINYYNFYYWCFFSTNYLLCGLSLVADLMIIILVDEGPFIYFNLAIYLTVKLNLGELAWKAYFCVLKKISIMTKVLKILKNFICKYYLLTLMSLLNICSNIIANSSEQEDEQLDNNNYDFSELIDEDQKSNELLLGTVISGGVIAVIGYVCFNHNRSIAGNRAAVDSNSVKLNPENNNPLSCLEFFYRKNGRIKKLKNKDYREVKKYLIDKFNKEGIRLNITNKDKKNSSSKWTESFVDMFVGEGGLLLDVLLAMVEIMVDCYGCDDTKKTLNFIDSKKRYSHSILEEVTTGGIFIIEDSLKYKAIYINVVNVLLGYGADPTHEMSNPRIDVYNAIIDNYNKVLNKKNVLPKLPESCTIKNYLDCCDSSIEIKKVNNKWQASYRKK